MIAIIGVIINAIISAVIVVKKATLTGCGRPQSPLFGLRSLLGASFPLKIEESDLTSEVENVDLVILRRSVRSVPRNSHFARPTSHQETEGTEKKKKKEETDSLEDGQTASLATPNAHPCSQE